MLSHFQIERIKYWIARSMDLCELIDSDFSKTNSNLIELSNLIDQLNLVQTEMAGVSPDSEHTYAEHEAEIQ